jgi:2-oxoisovalerate dehydrogenase E2 component (dihydrolipoyl transacylase)
VNPPNQVAAFDALCEVQSDKASVEITSPFDGVVKDILVKEGEVAKVGAGLCIIEVDEEFVEEESSSPPPPLEQVATQSAESLAEKPQVATQDVAKPPASPQIRKPHPLDPNVPQEAKVSIGRNAENVLATPSVRHFARQNGVDLAKLAPGSGKNGRIEKSDVEAYLAGPKEPVAAAPAPSQPAADDIVIELGRTRYGMWKAMVKVRLILALCCIYQFVHGYSELGDPSFWILDDTGPHNASRAHAYPQLSYTLALPSTFISALASPGHLAFCLLC